MKIPGCPYTSSPAAPHFRSSSRDRLCRFREIVAGQVRRIIPVRPTGWIKKPPPPVRPSCGLATPTIRRVYPGSETRKSNFHRRRPPYTLGAARAELWAIAGTLSLCGTYSCAGAASDGTGAGATSCVALSLAISRWSSVARSSRIRSCSVRRCTNDSRRATWRCNL